MKAFSARIYIIGINPCVTVPGGVLKELFRDSGKTKGPIRVKGTLNGKRFRQTVVKYAGGWRFYLNTPMRNAAALTTGDRARIRIEFDPSARKVPMHSQLAIALGGRRGASLAFSQLPPYRRKEILRYLNALKTDGSVKRNIKKILRQLK